METADKCLSLWAMIFECKCRGREWEGRISVSQTKYRTTQEAEEYVGGEQHM